MNAKHPDGRRLMKKTTASSRRELLKTNRCFWRRGRHDRSRVRGKCRRGD